MSKVDYEYAGFWRRFQAWVVDAILVFLASGFFAITIGFIVILIIGSLVQDKDTANSIYTLTGGIIGFLTTCSYFIGFEISNFKATPGKRLFNMVVLDEKYEKIGFVRAATRFFSKLISGFLLCLGFIICLFTEKKQNLHDIIANTLVVMEKQPGQIDEDENL